MGMATDECMSRGKWVPKYRTIQLKNQTEIVNKIKQDCT